MSLAHEIVAALPALMEANPKGPRVKEVAAHVATPEANVRRAMDAIKAEALAVVVRWPGERGKRLVPTGFNFPAIETDRRRYHVRVVCAWCDTLFQNGSKKYCSKECFAQDMWSKPERREKGSAAGKRVAQTPAGKARTAKLIALQKSPEGRARQSERNRKDWADPVHKAKRAANMQAAIGRPENRKHMSELKRKAWENQEMRERACQRMRETRADPIVKARYSAAGKAKWRNPAYREKMAAHAESFGARSRNRKQTPEEKAKRVETRRKNAEARGYYRHPGEVTRPTSTKHKRKRDENTR